MNGAIQNFLSISLPIMFTLVGTIWVASWPQNKRFDYLRSDMNRRFEDVTTRLVRIEHKLDNHEERLVRVEERTSMVRH
jgi:hypothetical protein